LLTDLEDIPHLQRLRIHTRIPVVLPERATSRLATMLATCRLRSVVVIHANHANELNDSTARALAVIKSAGAWLLNQAVLLRGVNDSVTAQTELAKALFAQGVQPYYLHLPDHVAGTHHFFIDDASATQIYRHMQAILPGYLLAKLVREVPGEAAKRIINV
jgi:KamA family protein